MTGTARKAVAESEAVKPPIRVGLFVTCLVDLLRPSVGFAAVKLLEDAGCKVIVPSQSCCGQPAFNSGDRPSTQAIARRTIDAFAGCDYVVAPSGSCAGMLAKHYPELFVDEPEMAIKATAFAAKCFELVSFLVDRLGVKRVSARYEGVAAYHDSCSGLRELGVRDQPRTLLAGVEGLRMVELAESDVCCGFGGTFAVKYGELSDAIVTRKSAKIDASGADTLIAGDLGCLLNMAGKMQREGRAVKARHVAEVLAGMGDDPAIGEPDAGAAS
ncbi:MAG: (Fe-S)-binding protein [Bradyrhizobium sp.]|nr:MAG: (Fe-S)-binding protein [Bradyrhizobium sp.]